MTTTGLLDLQRLDELVLEYVQAAGLQGHAVPASLPGQDGQGQKAPAASSGDALRDALLQGDSAAALQHARALQAHSATLQDMSVQLQLRKQHFIELLRAKKDLEALEYLKADLTPFALHAYPEAYSELQASLECLLCNAAISTGAAPADWSIEHRAALAFQVSTSLKLEAGTCCPTH